ncbi:MAG: trehalose-phosphatase [Steroidobacteraceae bacterium]
MTPDAPRFRPDWALFLDIDGTLIDIAPAPGAVEVSAALPPQLERLSQRLAGAVAFVSGRSIADIDRLFQPLRLPAAGVHGAERRDAAGNIHQAGFTSAALEPARAELRRFVAMHPGLELEDKGSSVAVHFRRAPQFKAAVREAVERVRAALPPEACLQPGRCVLELKSRTASKRAAVERFMQERPFEGRIPVFLGDDITDLEALDFVQSSGGSGIFVGRERRPGLGSLPDPTAVRAWLRSLEEP